MNTKNRKLTNSKKQKPVTIEELQQKLETLLKDIRNFIRNGNYIFRGEAKEYNKVSSKEYGKVSSTLYRELRDYMKSGEFDIQKVQETRLEDARKHTKEENGGTILEQTQHFGGSTNQIDFSTDYLVALFFACDGEHKQNGKLIFLDKDEFNDQIHEPRHPQNRVIAQKSVFICSPSGLIEVKPENTIVIDKELKASVLHYLRQHHDISAHKIYNDIHGYITRSKIHKLARKNFYFGFRFHEASDYNSAKIYYKRALKHDPIFEGAYNNLGNVYSSMKKYKLAIDSFSRAIALDPKYAMAYNGRGYVYNNQNKHTLALAFADFNKAIDLDPMYASAYVNRSIVYGKWDDHDLALADCNKAIKLNQNHAEAYYNRGVTKVVLQDYKGAMEDFETALPLAEQQGKKDLTDFIQNAIAKLAELEK